MMTVALNPEELFGSLKPGEELCLRVQGNSMSPFLKNGRDTVVLTKPVRLKKGAVVVFRRGGMFIMHRVISVNGDVFCALGDNLSSPETDIPVGNAVAMVKAVVRKGKKLTPHSPTWLFYSKVFTIPAVRKLIRKSAARR